MGGPVAAHFHLTMADTANFQLAEIIKEADRCVACGLCLPSCPTYRKTLSEADSPRGRIQLINAVAQGRLEPSARFAQHIGLCLSCRTCETVCPNGVRYGKLVDAARVMIAPKPGLKQRAATWLLQRRPALALAGRMLRLAELGGVRRLAPLLPARLRKSYALLPPVAAQPRWRSSYPASSAVRGEVVLFLGCVASITDASTLRAAIFVLNRLGISVHVPQEQSCCGAMSSQMGDSPAVARLHQRNRRAFAPHAQLPLLTVTSGCGSSLMDSLPNPVFDVSEFIAGLDWEGITIAPLAAEVLVHEPCSLRHAMRQPQGAYALLLRIPSATIRPLPGNDQCCGGAGAYMLTQPEMAQQLRDDKITAIRGSATTLLATSNTGCALHIAAGLREQGMTVEVLHPVTLLARQLGFDES